MKNEGKGEMKKEIKMKYNKIEPAVIVTVNNCKVCSKVLIKSEYFI